MERQTLPIIANGTLSSNAGTSMDITITIHASNTKLVVEVTELRTVRRMEPEGCLRFVGRVSDDVGQVGELVTMDKSNADESSDGGDQKGSDAGE